MISSAPENIGVVADIGGTFARFALVGAGAHGPVSKYRAADFPSVQDALARFAADTGAPSGGALRIATAGYQDGGVWKFVNNNVWEIDPAALGRAGWRLDLILNDFEAALWALPVLGGDEKTLWRAGEGASGSLCLLGPGTGLGLGYLHHVPGGKLFAQKTHGGHIPAAALTPEQAAVIDQVAKARAGVIVYENLVSGPGLHNIYKALCALEGVPVAAPDAEAMLALRDHEIVRRALRLFAEFMGLFSASALVAGHAYGGLYLTGGVLERLAAENLFDRDCFLEWMSPALVASVRRDLGRTPVHFITIPNPALKGLMVAA